MDYRRQEEDRNARKGLLAALLVSLLINYVVVAFLVARLIPDVPEIDDKIEIILEQDRQKEKEPDPHPETEEKKPAEPERIARPQPTARPVRPPVTMQPEPAGVPEAPISPEPIATSPEPPEPVPKNIKTELSWGSFERIFEETAAQARQIHQKHSMEKRRGALRMGSLTGKVKRALANNRSWVSDGEQVPLGKKTRIFRNYIEVAHRRIHTLFAHSFLGSLSSLDPSDPLNDFTLMTKMEFEILATGVVNDIHVIKTSGNSVFDAAAVDSIFRSSPFRPPPQAILSYNDRVYFRWGFYRNHRMCGVFNAEPYLLRAPGAAPEAIDPGNFMFDDG
jgi:outer membrane biosynthesis protein TonB